MTPSRPVLDLVVRVESLRDREKDVTFVASQTALESLATLIGVDKVLSCKAELRLIPERAGVDVTGAVRATVVQTCVVSLEPFETLIDEPIDLRFAPEREIEAAARPFSADAEEGSAGMADAPEPIEDGDMHLGVVLEEILALAVDPYPRKPGAAFEETAPDDDKIPSPFAALAQLKSDKKT